MRLWTEVNINNIGFGLDNREAAKKSGKKWFPYNKGGEFRKWYGNQQYVVNWENDGLELNNYKPKAVIRNPTYYFKESVSWSKVTSSYFSLRFYPQGFIFADAGMSIFSNDTTIIKAILGVMNSPVMNGTTGSLSPTLNFEVGQISNFPILNNTIDTAQIKITENIDQAINIS
ncbi:MAG: SAM-dependent methyltransferase, partial [Cylindrospermopsis raciborskii PAMP2011]|nr:SAM-dependent methyltransferase [Cylindrospermopsis raciborskii PAMP2011]